MACSHNVDNVINLSSMPSTLDELALSCHFAVLHFQKAYSHWNRFKLHHAAQVSILYDHVKDVAIQADQSERLLQGTPACHVNESQMAPASATGTIPPKATDSKSFINTEGQRQNSVTPPTQYK